MFNDALFVSMADLISFVLAVKAELNTLNTDPSGITGLFSTYGGGLYLGRWVEG
jgi:hypothetical protein